MPANKGVQIKIGKKKKEAKDTFFNEDGSPKKVNKQWVWFLIGFLAAPVAFGILGGFGAAISAIAKPKESYEKIVPVEIIEIQRTNLTQMIAYSGDIRGLYQADIYPPGAVGATGGTILQVVISEGQWVNRGQVLFTIDKQQPGFAAAVVTAPISGVVGNISVDVGENVSVQTKLCTIADYRKQVEVDLQIIERDAGLIQVGQPCHVSLSAFPDVTFPGSVVKTDPIVDSDTRTSSAVVRLDNPGSMIKPGMFSEVFVEVRELQNVYTIPKEAISHTANQQYV